MHIAPTTIVGLGLLVFALTLVPDKYKPRWIHRLNWWPILIGLTAVVVATVIVATPEFYALGILGDSTFFDLLVLAIGFQLQAILTRLGFHILAGIHWTVRFINWRIYVTCMMLALAFDGLGSLAQRITNRFFS